MIRAPAPPEDSEFERFQLRIAHDIAPVRDKTGPVVLGNEGTREDIGLHEELAATVLIAESDIVLVPVRSYFASDQVLHSFLDGIEGMDLA